MGILHGNMLSCDKLQRKSNIHSICMYVNILNVNKWIITVHKFSPSTYSE